MYTKQEIQKQRQAFWTTFGKYMQPILSADGEKVNWINYKTGIPGIQFKMDADSEYASISIVLSHNDSERRSSFYNKLLQLKMVLHEAVGGEWLWQPDVTDEYGKHVSKVDTTLHNINILRNEDWPQIISFFKPRIIEHWMSFGVCLSMGLSSNNLNQFVLKYLQRFEFVEASIRS